MSLLDRINKIETLEKFVSEDVERVDKLKLNKIFAKLKASIAEQQHYETLQLVKTINFRLLRNAEHTVDLVEFLYHTTMYLTKQKQIHEGLEVVNLFVQACAKLLKQRCPLEAFQALNSKSIVYHKENLTLDIQISTLISQIASLHCDQQANMLCAEALKVLTYNIFNLTILHYLLAKMFLRSEKHAEARYHFLHCATSENGEEISKFLVEYHLKNGYVHEVDMFITQFILQNLSMQQPKDAPRPIRHRQNPPELIKSRTRRELKELAKILLTKYTLHHPKIQKLDPPYTGFPLLNYLHMVIELLDTNETETFKVLMGVYEEEHCRDAFFKDSLIKIGSVYLGIVDQREVQSGLFGNLLRQVLQNIQEQPDDTTDSEIDDAILSPLATSERVTSEGSGGGAGSIINSPPSHAIIDDDLD